MKVAIIKYNAGNIQSVKYAFERLGVEVFITDDPEEIKSADKVVFPGVGEASSAMSYLQQNNLVDLIKGLTQPVLGICIGLQLMCQHSEENDVSCMNIFPVAVRKFTPGTIKNNDKLKIPHMGWNNIDVKQSEFPLFKGLSQNAFVYYVHSYCADLHEKYTVATTEYSCIYSAALYKDNFYAVQFHPEKSGEVGQQILQNFLDI